jgi:hypothetical protein
MGIEHIPNSDLTYYLVNFDAEGRERRDDADGMVSERISQQLREAPITDVFLMSHGWKGDIAAARQQYGQWIATAVACESDLAMLRLKRPNFAPLMVGLHWPSLPFGDEELGGSTQSFSPQEAPAVDELVDRYAAQIADTLAARAALRTIIEAALEDPEPNKLPPAVYAAYQVLDQEASLGSDGAAGTPAADREAFEPEAAYQNSRGDPASFGSSIFSGLLSPLVQLSFWKMKARACNFGEGGSFKLLSVLQRQTQSRGVRFHLMGHSFGCIVMSATAAGPVATSLPRPVDSLLMVQGAFSHWSYCNSIPSAPDKAGYFHRILTHSSVAGPIVATVSAYDSAVGRLYPLAAGVARQVNFAEVGALPIYGAVGSFGLRGPGLDVVDQELLTADQDLAFSPGKVYNMECSRIIRQGSGLGGAHNDISHPELAHVFWSAAMASL